MTVYSKEISNQKIKAVAISGSSNIFKVNFVLGLAMIVTVFAYVFLANLLVSQKYSLDVLKRQYNKQSASLAAASIQNENDYDIGSLLTHAQKTGMVEAKNTDSVMSDAGVAFTR